MAQGEKNARAVRGTRGPAASSAAAPFAARTVRSGEKSRRPAGEAYSLVKYIEMPWPPPMHMETIASCFSG